jgi:hypothetical protein
LYLDHNDIKGLFPESVYPFPVGIVRSAKEVHPLYRVVGISPVGSLNRKATV